MAYAWILALAMMGVCLVLGIRIYELDTRITKLERILDTHGIYE